VRNGFDPEAYLTSVLHRFAEHLDQPHRRATAMESFPTLVWREFPVSVRKAGRSAFFLS
jgi:hypothetical protein